MTESNGKRKRGRPRRFSQEVDMRIAMFYPDVKTRRGLLNCHYRTFATSVFTRAWESGDRRFEWICHPKKMEAGERNSWRPGILEQLGRIAWERSPDVAIQWAADLEPNMKTKDAVALLRQWRVGRSAGDRRDLAKKIIHTVAEYGLGHDGVDLEFVLDAFDIASDALKEADSENE